MLQLPLTIRDSCVYSIQGKQYSCAPGENGTVLCAVGNPMVHNQEAKFTIRLDPGKVTTTAEKLNITIRVTT